MLSRNLKLSLAIIFLSIGLAQGLSALSFDAQAASKGSLFLESFGGLGQGLQGIHVVLRDGEFGTEAQATDATVSEFLAPLCEQPNLRLVLRYQPSPMNQRMVEQVSLTLASWGLPEQCLVFEPILPEQEKDNAEGMLQVTFLETGDAVTTAALPLILP